MFRGFLGFLLAALCLYGGGAAAEARKLRFGTFLPAPTINVRHGFVPWIETVNEGLAGVAEIELFAGGAMGRNGKAQLKLVESGVLDITLVLPHYTPGQFPDAELFEIPVFETDALETSLVFWRMYGRGLLKGFDRIHPLALYVTTPAYLHMNFAYRAVADLKGRKIRATTLFQARVIEDLGGTPIGGITATQIAESLSRGLLDGAIFNWFAARRPMGITQVTSHHLEKPLAFTPGIIAMNKKSYESLPVIARRRLDDLSGEALIRRIVGVMAKYAGQSHDQSGDDPGRVFIAAASGEGALWDAAFRRQLERWKSGNGRSAALLEAYAELLAQVRAGGGAGGGGGP